MLYPVLCSLLVACGFQASSYDPAARPDAPAAPDAAVQPDAPAPPDAAPLTPLTLIDQMVAMKCAQAFACKPHYPRQYPSFDHVWGTDQNNCAATDRDYLARDRIAAAVTAGTIRFDPASAAICLAAPGFPTNCTTFFMGEYRWAEACYAALVGQISDGAVCTTDWECVSGSSCRDGRCSR
jgi:hypothetical protein